MIVEHAINGTPYFSKQLTGFYEFEFTDYHRELLKCLSSETLRHVNPLDNSLCECHLDLLCAYNKQDRAEEVSFI